MGAPLKHDQVMFMESANGQANIIWDASEDPLHGSET